MKNKCRIVQDLMPLVIDGAASEESRDWVGSHVSECHACAEVYGQMKTELPRIAAQKEREEFEAAARQMKRQRRKRIIALVLAGLVLGCMLIFGGQYLYNYLMLSTTVMMDLDEFSVQLYRMQDGSGVIVYDQVEDALRCGAGMGYGGKTAKLQLYRTPLKATDARMEADYGGYRVSLHGVWTDEGWLFGADGVFSDEATAEPVQQVIVMGADGQQIIYQAGDEVPCCSPEMEAYISYTLSTPYWEKEETVAARLRSAVPEWQ